MRGLLTILAATSQGTSASPWSLLVLALVEVLVSWLLVVGAGTGAMFSVSFFARYFPAMPDGGRSGFVRFLVGASHAPLILSRWRLPSGA